MKNQLQGIALILFAGVLMLCAPISPWIPVIGSLPSDLIALWDWLSPSRDWYGALKRKADRFRPLQLTPCSINLIFLPKLPAARLLSCGGELIIETFLSFSGCGAGPGCGRPAG